MPEPDDPTLKAPRNPPLDGRIADVGRRRLKQAIRLSDTWLVLGVALVLLLMTAVVLLYGYGLFLQALWTQVSISRMHFNLALDNNARYEYFVRRAARVVRVASPTGPWQDTVSSNSIQEQLRDLPASSVRPLRDIPTINTTLVFTPRGTYVPRPEFTAAAVRFAFFEREYWGRANPIVLYSSFLSNDGPSLVMPASDAPERLVSQAGPAPDIEDLQRAVRTRYAQLRELGRQGAELWVGPYRDPLTGRQVVSCFAPVDGMGGPQPALFVSTTITGEQLVGEAAVVGTPQAQSIRRLILFSGDSGGVIYQGRDTVDLRLDGLFDRIGRQMIGHGPMALAYWFEQGRLMIAGGGKEHEGRGVYVYPVAAILTEYSKHILGGLTLLLLGWLAVVVGAIYLRRRVLVPLHKDALRLGESEHFNRTMFQTAPVGLRVVGVGDGRVRAENAMATRILPDATRTDGQPWAAPLLAQTGDELQLELQVPGANGAAARDVQVIGRPTRFRGTDVLLCAINDISRERAAQRDMARAHQLADEASAAKSQFFAVMSHEIRTPLHGVLGTLELLALSELTPAQRQQLMGAQTASKGLLRILNDLLDYSKMEALQFELDSAPFDPIEAVETAVRAQWPLARRRGLALYCHIATDLPWLAGDAVRVRQIVDNLITNAVKFTNHGWIRVRLQRAAIPAQAPDRLRLELDVADSGIGIAPEQQERLFEPFAQADSSSARREGGTGLGLSICKCLAALMHGQISVSSTPGKGSRFTVTMELEVVRPRESLMPALPPVVVLTSEDMRDEILTMLRAIDEKVTAYVPGAPDPNAVLVVGVEQTVPADAAGFAGILLVRPDGPMEVQHGPQGHVVSCYHQQGMFRAVRVAAGLAPGPSPSDVMPVQTHALPQLGLRLLVVDDHPYGRWVTQQQLRVLGCQVRTAASGAEALQACRERSFDAVLTDVHMPEMHGYAFVQHLRDEGIGVPVVGLTASNAPGEAERCLAAGMQRYLSKPASLVELARCLQSLKAEQNIAPRAVPAARHQRDDASSGGSAPGPQADAPFLSHPASRALFVQTLNEDLDGLTRAIAKGEMHALEHHAHRMRGALVLAEGGEALAELCHELESDATQSLDTAQARLDDLKMYVTAFLEEWDTLAPRSVLLESKK